MSSNSVCNHTRDKQIGLPLRGRPILLSPVWLQTELDSTQSYYHYLSLISRRSDCRKSFFTSLCCILSLISRVRRDCESKSLIVFYNWFCKRATDEADFLGSPEHAHEGESELRRSLFKIPDKTLSKEKVNLFAHHWFTFFTAPEF